MNERKHWHEGICPEHGEEDKLQKRKQTCNNRGRHIIQQLGHDPARESQFHYDLVNPRS